MTPGLSKNLKPKKMKLIGKIIIKGSLITQTGLHLGGSKSSLNIGSIDNNVIKTAKGVPYIPGSSIKGKLRSLLAKVEGALFFTKQDKEIEETVISKVIKEKKEKGSENIAVLEKYQATIKNSATDEDDDCEHIMELFGYSGDTTSSDKVLLNRLLVRDAFLENKKDPIFDDGFTDSKWENVINRKTGTAEHPRQLERVPVGASFGLELVYNIYEDAAEPGSEKFGKHIQSLLLALELLEDDGIGGSISRGYGQVAVILKPPVYKSINRDNMKYEVMEPVGQKQLLLAQFPERFSKQA